MPCRTVLVAVEQHFDEFEHFARISAPLVLPRNTKDGMIVHPKPLSHKEDIAFMTRPFAVL